jgi:hypothetical protein
MPGVAVVNQPSVTPRTDAGVEIDFATEAKLEAVRVLLASLDGKDFATQATLDAFLTAFNGEDFASQATLQALLTAFNSEDFASQTTLQALLTAFNAEDFATQTTLLAADGRLATIDSVLDSIKDTDGIKKITDPVGLGAGTEIVGKVYITDGVDDATITSSARSTSQMGLTTRQSPRTLSMGRSGSTFPVRCPLLRHYRLQEQPQYRLLQTLRS